MSTNISGPTKGTPNLKPFKPQTKQLHDPGSGAAVASQPKMVTDCRVAV